MSRHIEEGTERRLYAESMGKCMNPDCKVNLFKENGDIMERAHIDPYCQSNDNSFENLVILCPNCHTDFDKNEAFTKDIVRNWKQIRREELDGLFCEEFGTFRKLKAVVREILLENRTIFEHYYKDDRREMWDQFEIKILMNNRKLKIILNKNLHLFQKNSNRAYSNLDLVMEFLLHIDEFEKTRSNSERIRHVIFPARIDSLFGLEPVRESFIQSVESVEALISKLINRNLFEEVVLGVDNPYFLMKEEDESVKVYFGDTPALRQLYSDFNCFRPGTVRFESLNYALRIIRKNDIDFDFYDNSNLRRINLNGKEVYFVYEYCLSVVKLKELLPNSGSIVVNLHHWNGSSSISKEAEKLAQQMRVVLLTTENFYDFITR